MSMEREMKITFSSIFYLVFLFSSLSCSLSVMESSRRRVSFLQYTFLLFNLDFTLVKAGGQVSVSCLAQVGICSNKKQQKVSGQNSFQIPAVIKDRCTWNTSLMPLLGERKLSELM